jgi:hypothetical protein
VPETAVPEFFDQQNVVIGGLPTYEGESVAELH